MRHPRGALRFDLARVLALVSAFALLAPAEPAGPAESTESAPADAPPHVVLLVIDTLRVDVFEDVLASTPEGRRLERALGGAVYFHDAVAAGSWTRPSMGTIFTGLYPREHGFVAGVDQSFRRLTAGTPTLAEILAEEGYWTEAHVANPLLHAGTGVERGFDVFLRVDGGTRHLPLLRALVGLGALGTEYYPPAQTVSRPFARRWPAVVDACRRSGRRAFFWVHLMDPHLPLHRHSTFGEDLDAASGDETLALYRGETRHAVDHAARIVETIREGPASDETLVVLVSDHGEMLPSDRPAGRTTPSVHGHGHVLYEPLVRVPLVIRPPGGLDARRHVDALVSHVDLLPTILDFAAPAVRPAPGTGRSLAPWLGEDPSAATGRDWVLASHVLGDLGQRTLRVGARKLIVYGDTPGAEGRDPELYDVESDPGEARDLAAVHPREVRALARRLDEIWSRLEPPEDSRALELDAETRRRLEALGYLQPPDEGSQETRPLRQ